MYLPRSRGEATVGDLVAAACAVQPEGNRTPEEMGWTLSVRHGPHAAGRVVRGADVGSPSWEEYTRLCGRLSGSASAWIRTH